jgi:hypothetical protein
LGEELRVRWTRMLVLARRARLLAYRVLDHQSTGRVRPGDAAAYRIAVTRLDQESAEVLMDIVAAGYGSESDDFERFARSVGEHFRYSVSATVASGSIHIQKILLARSLMS